jgi:hypothetical protein
MPAATVTKQPPLAVDLETAPPVSGLPAPAQPSAADMLSMIERLASNPDVDVTKLEKIIDLKERVMAHDAKSAFEAAFSKMQPEIPVIDERGRIEVSGKVRSTYAPLEDIHDVIKPILAKHGFSIRHKTEWPADKTWRDPHRGHPRTRAGPQRIHGVRGADGPVRLPHGHPVARLDVSYGRRYTTLDLLNISTRGMDDDGRKSGRPEPPAGYDDFALALSKEAEKGLDAVQRMFSAASEDYRKYLTQHDADAYKKIRERARTGKAATS